MPIEIKSIEYTNAGVNIIGTEYDEEVLQLADGTTRVLRSNERGYAAPMGLNDFDGDQELARQKIAEHVAKVTGEAVASPVAEVAVLRAEKQQLEAQVNETRTNLETERAARQLAESQRDKLLQPTQPADGKRDVDPRNPVLESDV
jgi:hypothetical protein